MKNAFSVEDASSYFESGDYIKSVQAYEFLLTQFDENSDDAIQAQFALALSYYQTLDFYKAKSYLEKIVDIYPCAEVYLWLFETMFMLGQADDVFDQAFLTYSYYPDSRIAGLAIRSARYLGKWAVAKALIDRVLSNDIDDRIFLSEALLFQLDCPSSDFGVAYKNLLFLYEQMPHDENVAFALVYAAIRNSDQEIAISVLNKMECVGVSKNVKSTFLAWCDVLSGQYLVAQEKLFFVLDGMPKFILASIVLGYSYLYQNIYIRAAHAFSVVLNKNEGFHRESREMSVMLTRRLHNYPMAFRSYAKLVAVDAAEAKDLFAMAWIAFHNEEYDYIRSVLSELIKSYDLLASSADARAVQAILDCADGEFGELLNLSTIFDGDSVFFYYAQCIRYAVCSDYENAELYAKKALELFPDDLLLTKALVDIYIRQARWIEAQEVGEPVLKICSSDFELRSQMMMIAIEIKDETRLEEHDRLMFRHCLNKYEDWLWDKIGEGTDDTNTSQMYVQLCLFAINNMCNHSFEARAEELCLRFIALDDSQSKMVFLKLLIQLYMTLERFDEAKVLLDREDFSEAPDLNLLLAGYYASLSDYPQAEHFANLAFKLSKEGYREAAALASIYAHLGGHRQRVFDLCDRAIELNPSNKQLKWNSSYYAGIMGHAERYEKYLDVALEIGLRTPCRRFMPPLWQGESLAGKTIFVWREQGVGDELWGAMYIPNLIAKAKAEGGTVKIECTDRLLPLFRRSFSSAQVDCEALDDDMSRTDFDFHVPMLSIRKNLGQPFVFPVDRTPRFIVRDDLQAKWRDRVAKLGRGLKVGICWRSGLKTAYRSKFYADYEDLAPLLTLPDVHWVNLNYAGYREDQTDLKSLYGVDMHVWDDLDLKNDFESMAALTAELDLVISATSAPGSLANGLGRPTWIFTLGADQPNSEPTYDYTINYPALTWLRHYTESFGDVFGRMAKRLQAPCGALDLG